MTLLPETLTQLHQGLAANQTKESAWNIIDEYFRFFGLEDVHHELWLLTAGTLTNEEMQASQKATCRRAVAIDFGRAPSLKLWRKRPETGRQVDRRNPIFLFEPACRRQVYKNVF